MQHYLYKGVEYKSERELRKAIFEQERKVFGSPKTSAEWAEFGVELIDAAVANPVAPRIPDLNELKQMKMGALDGAFYEYRHSNETYIVSSLISSTYLTLSRLSSLVLLGRPNSFL